MEGTAGRRERERELGAAALDVLVDQFKNPYDFIRELVQNSLDSGTPTVDVWLDFKEAGDGPGVCEIHVDDYGSGMDEQIIDQRLTCLFSSTKEDDLTNIGKFGIGFVSVFAVSPEAVIVRTARGGERWEVFFDRDRTFEKTPVREPFEGTHVTVFKAMHRDDYDETATAVLETLTFWCKHARKKIEFRDRVAGTRQTINRPMEIDGYLPIRIVEGETEMVLAFSDHPLYGFYNQGLTLTESYSSEVLSSFAPFFTCVSFRIKSPYLEHTLTRDTILRDANYVKAMNMLVGAARGNLVRTLIRRLEKRAPLPALTGRDLELYVEGLSWLYRLPRELDPTYRLRERLADTRDNVTRVVLPSEAGRPSQKSIDAEDAAIFRRCNEGACSMRELRSAVRSMKGHLLLMPEESESTDEMRRAGKQVFLSPVGSAARTFFFDHVMGRPKRDEDLSRIGSLGEGIWVISRLKRRKLDRGARELLDAVRARLEQIGFPLGRLEPVHYLGQEPGQNVLSGILGRRDVLVSRTMISQSADEVDLALNMNCATCDRLVRLHASSPELAVTIAVRRIVVENVEPGNLEKSLMESLLGAAP